MKSNRLDLITNYLVKNKISGFIIPSNDAFQSEYVPAHARRLEWLTGFSGSNGVAIVLQKKAAFFTDGRYTLQAEKQVPKAFEHYNIADKKPWEWLKEQGAAEIAFDPWLHTRQNLAHYEKFAIKTNALEQNPIDSLWEGRSVASAHPIVLHPEKYAGISSAQKRQQVADFLIKERADYLLVTAPDSVCWLLNIRGNDVPCTPLALSYALVDAKGRVKVFFESAFCEDSVQKALGKEVSLYSVKDLKTEINNLKYKKIIVDESGAPIWFPLQLKQDAICYKTDPCQLPKACKNTAEIRGTKSAHIRDGVALTKGLYWVDGCITSKTPIKEIDVSNNLLKLRANQKYFKQESFPTIAGFGSNGAIVHYQPDAATSAVIKKQKGAILLMDSGGQYLDGTTDITRTVPAGQPTAEQKRMFTLVLKGHIALATARFAVGTSGSALDALARQYLWQYGADYDHGTGHGVGSYLGVHEGPQRISKLPNSVALRPGMIVSNEPGYYKTGEYGIRIESLVLVKESKFKGFLEFETISCAPIDMRLVDKKLLTKAECDWLESYHAAVLKDLKSGLSKAEQAWFKRITKL